MEINAPRTLVEVTIVSTAIKRPGACVVHILLILFLMEPVLAQDANKAERELLKGKWKLVVFEVDGQPQPFKDRIGSRIVIGDNNITSTGNGAEDKSDYTIDAAKSPKWIDFMYKAPKERAVAEGIYKCDGKELTICLGLDKRPTQFTSKRPEGLVLCVYKREP